MTGLEIALSGYLAFGQLLPTGQVEIQKYAGIQAIHADGAVTLRLNETGRQETEEDGGKHIVITLDDAAYPFHVTRHVKTWPDCSAVETWVEIRHEENAPVKLLKMDSFATSVPFAKFKCSTLGKDTRYPVPYPEVKILSLAGIWAREANVRETSLAPGQLLVLSSRAGTRDAWESNAGMMVSFGENVSEEKGTVLGIALEWTGTTCRTVRRNWLGDETEIFAGVDMETGPYTLDPGVTVTTPKAIVVLSEKGRGEVSRQFHRWARNHLMPHGRELHPVLLNSWEGSYFSFTEKTLTDMMDGVKELGGEMFVLDDGWFGKGKYARDDKNQDKTGLGDWYVNPEKLPRGLGYLADECEKRGLKFGLWVEPEMVNVKSWLAEAHPEWILREEKRPLALGRGGTQVVLDMTNPAVRDYLFETLDKVYSDVPSLAYIKWDSNQNIVNPGSTYLKADRQPNLWFDYTKGLYELLARFQAKRPGIMTQACSSGGGHADFGFLRYADEFWASDNTDAYMRVFIQWGESMFYPACAMACHVTASPNHQTHRETPLKYRFDVAMTGRMGFELHPKNLSAEELAFAKAAVADYKRIRPVVQQGDLYRLASPYENPFSSLMYVDDAKSHAVAFALGLQEDGEHAVPFKLRGLDPARKYRVTEINRGKSLHLELPADAVSGADLMAKGLPAKLSGKFDSCALELVAE